MAAILLFPAVTRSQNPEWMQFRSDGSEVRIIEDGGDYLWIGKPEGLIRLDKATGETALYNTANSGLPSNVIYSLAVDGQSSLWIGTDNGLARFDGEDWWIYTTDNSGLPSNQLVAFNRRC